MRELQMWCPAPLPEGEIQRRKLSPDKYKPPIGRLLENYESDSSVEADEDTDVEAGADLVVGVAMSRRRTRSTVAKKSAPAVATAISSVRAAEQKKKRKRKRRATSPSAVTTPTIPTPRSQEVGSEDDEEEKEKGKEKDEAIEELPVPEYQAVERPESPAAKRQQKLVQKTSEEALRRGLEAQRSAAAARAKIPTAICTPTYGVCSLAGHDPVEGFIRSTVGHLLHCGFITSTASLSLGTPLSILQPMGYAALPDTTP
jgi:hypothetical protein